MATIPSGIWPIDATVTSGTELAQYLNDWVQAFNTQSANATRPPTIQRGGVWAKTLGAADIALMMYDGTTDFQIGSIVGGSASFGGGTNAGTTAPASPAVGDMWYDTGANLLKIYDGANWNTVSPPLTPITLDAVNNRVGINQATPTQALDITGAIKADNLTVGATAYPNAGALSNRNILINGSLKINQRGVPIGSAATGSYGPDRWKKTAGGMTQIVEDVNFIPNTVYTLSGNGVTTQQITSPASGHWTLPDIPITATNIQLELGTTATPFEHRSFGAELALCQRYYQWNVGGAGAYDNATPPAQFAGSVVLPVAMRAIPTISVLNRTDAIDEFYVGRRDIASGSTPAFYDVGPSGHPFTGAPAAALSTGGTAFSTGAWMPGHWSMDAEL